jgi:hypothetical protein
MSAGTHAQGSERGRRPPPGTPAPTLRTAGARRWAVPQRALAASTAALLAVDAYVHARDASLYDGITDGTLSQGTLFRGQALVATVVAVTLALRPRPAVWAIAALVAASAAGAVVLYTYVDVGPLGPLPDMYEPTWALPGKAASAVAESGATVLALVGLATALLARRREVHGARR